MVQPFFLCIILHLSSKKKIFLSNDSFLFVNFFCQIYKQEVQHFFVQSMVIYFFCFCRQPKTFQPFSSLDLLLQFFYLWTPLDNLWYCLAMNQQYLQFGFMFSGPLICQRQEVVQTPYVILLHVSSFVKICYKFLYFPTYLCGTSIVMHLIFPQWPIAWWIMQCSMFYYHNKLYFVLGFSL